MTVRLACGNGGNEIVNLKMAGIMRGGLEMNRQGHLSRSHTSTNRWVTSWLG